MLQGLWVAWVKGGIQALSRIQGNGMLVPWAYNTEAAMAVLMMKEGYKLVVIT